MAAMGRTGTAVPSEDAFAAAFQSLDFRGKEELKDILAEIIVSNEALEKENRLFEKYQKRLDRRDAQLKSISTARSSQMEKKKTVRMKTSSITEDRPLTLTLDQKCNIAARELEGLREEIGQEEEEAESSYDNLRAVVAEAEMRLAEIQKATYEFDREIVRGSVSPHTGKIMGEKVVKYLQDRQKLRDGLAEKLRLKNATLKGKRKKLQSQLKQKEEAGDVKHEVDFQQLKIENRQLTDKFDSKNQELLKLKHSSVSALQILNAHKKRLQALSLESKQLDVEVSQRRDLQDKVADEMRAVSEEKRKAEEVNSEARRKLEDYRVPDVMEYVQERATLYEVTKAVRAWERKVEITEMALRTYQQMWKRMCSQNRQQHHTHHTHTTTSARTHHTHTTTPVRTHHTHTTPVGRALPHHTTPLY